MPSGKLPPVGKPGSLTTDSETLAKRAEGGSAAVGKKRLRRKGSWSFLRDEDEESNQRLKQAALISTGVHIVGPPVLIILTLVSLLLLSWLLHLDLLAWLKPHAKPDLTFTLVADSNTPKPKEPKFKGNANQEAGGKQKLPDLKPRVEDNVNPQTPPNPPKTEPDPTPEQSDKTPPPQSTIPKPDNVKTSEQAKPNPVNEQQTSKPNVTPTTINTPQPAAQEQSAMSPQTGEQSKPGVDVAKDPDLGPFLADFEKRLKRNWVPPRGAESRKVRLMLYLQRDGSLLKVETLDSSGDKNADDAAVSAAQRSAPFQPLPAEIQEDVLPVEFTFDYNVLNPGNKKRAMSDQHKH